MILDHIVVHVESLEEINTLKAELDRLDIPFEPTWGKAAKGFQVSNIWVGQQYFEIVNILSSNNLWQPQWAARHAQGERGVYCVFFKVNEDIHQLYKNLKGANILVNEPERTCFKWMFGLLEKKLPWRFMLLPKIPGTRIELGIIQYDKGAEKKYAPFMVPNTKDKGIVGLRSACIYTDQVDEADAYLEEVGRLVNQTVPIQLNKQVGSAPGLVLELQAELDADVKFSGFNVSNVAVVS
ncbi:hypothetical protein SPB21_14265 [Leptothoe sp. ISB3NOV94-8A]